MEDRTYLYWHMILNVLDSEGRIVTQTAFTTDEVEMPGYVETIARGYRGTEWTVQPIWIGPAVA